MPDNEPQVPVAPCPRCINLACKSLVVFGEAFESDPDYQAGMVDLWCALTGKGQGPDGAMTAMEFCVESERSCYAAY